MSKTLVCLQETIPFYAQESSSVRYSYDESAVKGSMPSYGDGPLITQDENACIEGHVPRVFSRKREATNILMECVKRRDNLQNMDMEFISNVLPVWDSPKVYIPPSSAVPTMSPKLVGDFQMTMDFVDSSSVDSKLGLAPENNSSCQDVDDVSRIDSEEGNLLLDSKSVAVNNIREVSRDSSSAICADQTCLNPVDEGRSPFITSLFTGVARILYFPTKDEKVTALPKEILTRMKWKLSTITPVIIKEMLLQKGFKLLEAETTDNWIGTWGKHLKCALFKDIKHYQKVNHFPGSFHLGRKDKLWANIKRLRERRGHLACDFFPDTFLLPQDHKALKDAWDADKCWILKPPASARGTGVKVIYKWSQIPKKPMIVQRYLSDPYLINGTKFDLRVYVLVPSIEPLRIYVFQDGLVRFASQKYSLSDKSFSNRFVHLTNYSINRKSSTYTYNEDENSCQGHKWTLKAFWTYMTNCGIDVTKIKETITDMIIRTIICAETPMTRLVRTYSKSTYNCYELFGFDIMLDKNLKPWLLEVNISPSLHTRSMLDSSVKGHLVQDIFNLVGFQVPGDTPHVSEQEDYGITSLMASKYMAPKHRFLSPEEKKKHSYHTFEYPHQGQDILGSLTPDDVRCLVESEDEFHRRGAFSRIFPTHTTSHYFPLFEHTRYYNLLLDAWERAYHAQRQEGVQLLQSLCKERYHLKRKVSEGNFLVHPDPAPESA
ncbi:tubulin monoglutamylase TTLL4-like [Uloborus diversus]|uniref:tubulin monoglutamylase TTLL4-like n=1 Tax=Uloborus diversus TaxID=327109 RepID=UPI0024091351|nr:tubulin monoglutamylase TTLL4-like [Uloborus diversus]